MLFPDLFFLLVEEWRNDTILVSFSNNDGRLKCGSVVDRRSNNVNRRSNDVGSGGGGDIDQKEEDEEGRVKKFPFSKPIRVLMESENIFFSRKEREIWQPLVAWRRKRMISLLLCNILG